MIGEIVLFRIHEDPPIDRPLLVVSDQGSSLSGELFLDWDPDRAALWVQKNSFFAPHQGTRTMEVRQVAFGLGLGQWHKREA